MLAFVNLGTGVVNLVLSIALIKPFGLVGVAVGTLIPIAFSSIFILYPAACRRVGVAARPSASRSRCCPALWPALRGRAAARASRATSHPARFWL